MAHVTTAFSEVISVNASRNVSFIGTLAVLAAFNSTAGAQSAVAPPAAPAFAVPAWAFPGQSPPYEAPKLPFDSVTLLHVPHSRQGFSLAHVRNVFDIADWFPRNHPPLPDPVAHGRKPTTWACGYCHLPDGQGRSENATLAGLPAEYIVRQVADIRTGARHLPVPDWGPMTNMRKVAENASDAEVVAAARYFARLRAKARYAVLERDVVPVTYQVFGLYAAHPAGGTEALGQRLIEMTNDVERHELRDPGETFTTFVPIGSIERGRHIATAGKQSPTSCVTCHGAALRGVGPIPPIAGRSPAYLLRQLIAFRTGARAASTSAPMQTVAAALDLNDMIAVAAYAGSRRP